MPYFLLIPLFLVGVVAQGALLTATNFSIRLAPWRPCLWRVLLWSSVGFVVANLAITVVCMVPFVFGEELHLDDSNPLDKTIGIVAGIGLFVGPFVASVVGFGWGVLIGIRNARGKARTD